MGRMAYSADGAISLGSYSQAVESGGFVYLSGQIPLVHQSGKLIDGDISKQAKQCIDNSIDVLRAINLILNHVVKVNVFLTNVKDFGKVNEVFTELFKAPYPARTTIGVAALPLDA